MTARRTALLALGLVVASAAARAEETSRPDEGSLFGGPEAAKPAEPGKPPAQAPSEGMSGASKEGEEALTDDKLQLGGKYYQRLILSGQRGISPLDGPLSAPLQFDGFVDARPNDRLRGFINSRLIFDPTRDQFSRATGGATIGNFASTTTSTAPSSLGAGAAAAPVPNNPTVALDQAWLKFDMNRAVFVTAGRQHVKWGAARFWNPTDFLHTQRRDPLLPYDLRLGNSMVKFEIPWSAAETNFYAVALFDNPQPASTLRQTGGAFRVEKVLGNGEVGVEAIFRGGTTPVYGLDASTELGPFDVFLEAACLTSPAFPQYSVSTAGFVPGADVSTLVTTSPLDGPFAQASMGANYQFGWTENRQATLGVEYFYNQLGYTDARVYPALIFFGQFQPFYTARNYAAVYITAEGPDAERKTSYTLSTLANLSDKSFLSRLDFSWRVLTYLTFEAYADAHYGTRGGEFNFELQTPVLTSGTTTIPAFNVPSTSFDAGLGLRMSF